MHFLKKTYNLLVADKPPGTATGARLLTLLFLLTACEAEEPTREDSPEMITTVIVTFTPIDGGEPIIGKAEDPDADGIRDIETDGPVELAAGATYILTLGMYNDLADPDSDEYNISAEVEEEGAEHMLFFGWTGKVFANPSGDGNIDAREDPVLYEDADINGLPLGLRTKWTTATQSSGTLRIVLKHQPDLKSETSTSDMGESDLNVLFDLKVD
ncbi:MAG TPA: hypothetical protein VK658_20735 [Chryseolinea sp.]|nr:hypothetical protein [Chryseolinea sp.]